MHKIIFIACVLFGVLAAVSIEAWLRRHIGNKETASNVYTATMEKYSEFWRAQIGPAAVLLVVLAVPIAFFGGLIQCAIYAGGALFAFFAVFIGSRSFGSGVVSASSIASDGDIKSAIRSAYRGGAVMGLTIMSFAITGIGLMFFLFSRNQLIDNVIYFALGASAASVGARLSGSVLTSASKLAKTKKRLPDYTGSFVANGEDYIETLIMSVCAAIALAEIGVDSSGPTATFTATDTSRFPLMVASVGIAASVIGIFVFRPHTGKNAHMSPTASVAVTGLIVFAAAVYFSINTLEGISYSYCVGFGILAALVSAEFSKAFSNGSEIFKKNLPRVKEKGVDIPVMNGLSVGLISTAIPCAAVSVAILLSYSIGNYYGIALAAVGAASLTGVSLATREFACTSSSAGIFTEAADSNAEANVGYYNILRNISSKSKTAGKAYSAVAAVFTLAALMSVLSTTAGGDGTVDIMRPSIFSGMIVGIVLSLFIIGLVIRSVIISARAMMDESGDEIDEYLSVYSIRGLAMIILLASIVPLAIGCVRGVDCLVGFMAGCIFTGMSIVFALNNTGIHFDRTSSDVLGSIVKFMAVLSIAFLPAFMYFAGFLFS